jgi:hypothetical protein
MIWSNLVERIAKKDVGDIIPDFSMMSHLGFTPPSWKTWKSKLIEKASWTNYDRIVERRIETSSTNEKILEIFIIVYDKKRKAWFMKKVGELPYYPD